MLYPYEGPYPVPVWRLRLPRFVSDGEYVFAPLPTRPAGYVRFSSPEAARRYLRFHASRWGALAGARVEGDERTLGERVRAWRRAWSADPAGEPLLLPVLYLDPRPAFGGGGEFDAELLALAPEPVLQELSLPHYNAQA